MLRPSQGLVRRRYVFLFGSIAWLAACSARSDISHIECFESQERAKQIGTKLFESNFTHRVRYWLDGNAEQGVEGLGLQWGGLSSEKLCVNGHPLVITYDPKNSRFAPEKVRAWSKVVFHEMLKELQTQGRQ